MELANRSFRHPILVAWSGFFLGRLLLFLLLLFAGFLGGSFALFRGAIFALAAAFHNESLGVREFNVDVLLVHSRQLAIEDVSVTRFAHIELWRKAAHRGVTAAGTMEI